MYSSNLFNLLDEFWDKQNKTLNLNPTDDIIKGCVVTRGGEVVNEMLKR
jgi:NAD(P) transhydrogenase subunit alpha